MAKKLSYLGFNLAALALMSSVSDTNTREYLEVNLKPDPYLKERYEAILIKKGAKKFYYGDKYVIARDQKNADRKAKALGIYDNSIKKEA